MTYEEWLKRRQQNQTAGNTGGSSDSPEAAAKSQSTGESMSYEEWMNARAGNGPEELWSKSGIEAMDRDFWAFAKDEQRWLEQGAFSKQYSSNADRWRGNIAQERQWLGKYGARLGDNAQLISDALDSYEQTLNYYDSLYAAYEETLNYYDSLYAATAEYEKAGQKISDYITAGVDPSQIDMEGLLQGKANVSSGAAVVLATDQYSKAQEQLLQSFQPFTTGTAMDKDNQAALGKEVSGQRARTKMALTWLDQNRGKLGEKTYQGLKGYYKNALTQLDLMDSTIQWYADGKSAAVYQDMGSMIQLFQEGKAPTAELAQQEENLYAEVKKLQGEVDMWQNAYDSATSAMNEGRISEKNLQATREYITIYGDNLRGYKQLLAQKEQELMEVQEREAFYWALATNLQTSDEDAAAVIERGQIRYADEMGAFNRAWNARADEIVAENPDEEMAISRAEAQAKKEARQRYTVAVDSSHMTEEEKQNFFYLLGSGNDQLAIEYANATSVERRRELMAKWTEHASGTNILPATVTYSLLFPLAGADLLSAGYDVNTGLNQSSDIGPGGIRDAIVQGAVNTLNNDGKLVLPSDIPVLGGKGLGDLYSMALSGAESRGAAMAFGKYATLFLGLSAASSTYNQAVLNGADPEKAKLQAVSAGVFEALFESLSIGQFLDGKVTGSAVKDALIAAGVEASEETMTSIANEIADRLINQDQSQWERTIAQYRKEGMSRKEAEDKAWRELVDTIAWDTVAGGLIGGVMGSGQTAQVYKNADAYIAMQNSENATEQAMYQAAMIAAKVEADDSAEVTRQKVAQWVKEGRKGFGLALKDVVAGRASFEKAAAVEAEPEYTGQRYEMAAEEIIDNARAMDAEDFTGLGISQREAEQKETGTTVQDEENAQNPYYRTETGQRYEMDAEEALLGIRSTATELFSSLGRNDAEALGQMLAKAVEEGNISNSMVDRLKPTVRENLEAIAAAIGVEIQYTASKAEARKNVKSAVQQAAENYKKAQNQKITVSERYMEGVRELSAGRLAELIDDNTELRNDTGAVAVSRQQAQDILDALYAEQERRYGGRNNEEAASAGTTIRNAELQRNDRVGAGEQGGAVQERNAAQVEQGRQRTNDQGDRGKSVRAKRDLSRFENIAKTKSTRDYLGKAGAEEVTLGEVTEEYWTDEMRQAAEKAEAAGLTVHYVVGSILRANGDRGGGGVYYRGTILASVNDVRFLPEQLVEHEMYHADATEEATEEILAAIREKYTEEEFERIVREYADEYEGIIAEDDVQALYEEIAADAAGGMNRFADTGKVAESREQAQEIIFRKGKEAQRGDRARAPPASPEVYSPEAEVLWSTSRDAELMEQARKVNEKTRYISQDTLDTAAEIRREMKAILEKIPNLPREEEGSTFVSDSSYGGSEENITVCLRSVATDTMIDQVSEAMGRPLTTEEQTFVAQEATQYAKKLIECAYCYVAADRKAYREFQLKWFELRDAVLNSYKQGNTDLSANGKLMQTYARYESKIAKDFANTYNKAHAEEIRKRQKTKKKTKQNRKITQDVINRVQGWIDAYESGNLINAESVASLRRLDSYLEEAQNRNDVAALQQLTDLMAYSQAASWAKKRRGYVAYDGHIAQWKQGMIDKLNGEYGLRMYSFSDFSPAFILENMQMFTDAAARGLKVLAYTKEIDFARIFAPTGANINISVFGFATENGAVEDNIMGAPWAEAQALRAQYPNVSIVLVAVNKNMIEWGLNAPWVDVVIPYHIVRTGDVIAELRGYTNFTAQSHDMKQRKQWSADSDMASIPPTVHNNDKATYMAALQANHLKPRFSEWVDHPGYMKLVNETRQSYGATKPVQPVFDRNAAVQSLEQLKIDGYDNYIGGSEEQSAEIASGIAAELAKNEKPYLAEIGREGSMPEYDLKWSAASEADIERTAGREAVEDEDSRRPWEIVSDEKHAAAREMGYPVLDGEQVIPFQTWVQATDIDPDTGEPRNNYGLVVSNSVTTKQLGVNFWNKNAANGNRTEGNAEFRYVQYQDLHPVQGQYQMTDAEYESLMESVPEDVAREQIDFMGDNAAEFSKMYEEVLWQREQQRLRNEENGLELDEAPEGFPWSKKKPLRSSGTRLSPREAAKYLAGATGKEWNIIQDPRRGTWKAVPSARPAGVAKDSEYSRLAKEAKEAGATPMSWKEFSWQKLQENAIKYGEEITKRPVRPEGIAREEFQGTQALRDLGIRISGSVVDYSDTATMRERELALRKLNKQIKKMERALRKNEGAAQLGSKTITFANNLAEGKIQHEDIPATVNRRDVVQLAQLKMDYKLMGEDLSKKRKLAINRGLVEKAMEMLPNAKELAEDPEAVKAVSLLLLNYGTPEDNMYQIFGDKNGRAEKLYDYYFRTVEENEAEKMRWMNRMFDEASAFKDSKGKQSRLNKAESAYVHVLLDMEGVVQNVENSKRAKEIKALAEATNKKNTEEAEKIGATLTSVEKEWAEQYARFVAEQADAKANKKIDQTKCENAAQHYRKTFEKLYQALTDLMVTHGLTPLGHIDYYAPHLTINEKSNIMAGFFQELGLKSADGDITEIPADLAGRTQEFKPTKRWTPFLLKRKGTATDYDIVTAYETYLTYVADVLYHHDDILKLRGLETMLRNTANAEWQEQMKELLRVSAYGDINDKVELLQQMGVIDQDYEGEMSPEELLRWLDKNATVEDKHKYLVELGQLMPEEVVTEEQIHALFSELGTKQDEAFAAAVQGLLDDYGLMDSEKKVTVADATDKLNELYEAMASENRRSEAVRYSSMVNWITNYTNILAGKQYGGDRGAEYNGGRKMVKALSNTVRRYGSAKVVGNLSSVLSQVSQVPMIMAETSAKSQIMALRDIMAQITKENRVQMRGWGNQVDLLTGKKGVQYINEGVMEKITGTVVKPMELMDRFVSMYAARSAYYDALSGKIRGVAANDQDAATRYANDFARRIMASRAKGSKPAAFHSKSFTGTMLNLFQVEQLNTVRHMLHDMPRAMRQDIREYGVKKGVARYASKMMVYMLAAFLLNRGLDELYGQTPIPFDIPGYILQFVAAGYGVTANDLLTGQGELKDEFQWGDAFGDLGYEALGDVPLLNNALGILGWAEQQMPMPDVTVIADVFQSTWQAMTDEGVSGWVAAEAIAKALAEFIPGGSQIKKTVGGISALSREGTYTDDGRLKWAVDNDPWSVIQNILFGTSSTDEAQRYYARGYGAVSENLTEAYKLLTEQGIDPDDAYDAVYGVKMAWDANEDLSYEEKKQLQRDAIQDSNLDDEDKLLLWTHAFGYKDDETGEIVNKDAETFLQLMEADMSWDDIMEMYNYRQALEEDDTLDDEAADLQFAHWVETHGYTKEQKAVIVDAYASGEDRYFKLADCGISASNAKALEEAFTSFSKSLEEGKSITTTDKAKIVIGMGMSDADEYRALAAILKSGTLDRLTAATNAEISCSTWIEYWTATAQMQNIKDENDEIVTKKKDQVLAYIDGLPLTPEQKNVLYYDQGYAESKIGEAPWN